MQSISDNERFDRKYTKSADPDGCWLWIASVSEFGYGRFWFGRSTFAHRVSYQIHVGEIPDGLSVLHRCDTPACVNPKHLFLGTHADNMIDMKRKGRQVKKLEDGGKSVNCGVGNGMAKLSESQVSLIISDNRKVSEIAREFSICHQHVRKIKLGQRRRRSSANAE